MIYEGTNGIQALDLVGRKLMRDQGKAMLSLIQEMKESAKKSDKYSKELTEIAKDVEHATMWLAKNAIKDHEQAAAVANDYLHLCALALLALMWARMLESNEEFDENIAKYFFDRVLVQRHTLIKLIEAGKTSIVDLDDSSFD